jgi:hypothetical protein
MTTFIAINITLAVFAIVAGLLERAHRRYNRTPHLPFGADTVHEADFQRVLHDLDVHR